MVGERGTRLVLARHGESEANLAHVFANTHFTAHPLTPRGRAQAEQLAARLDAEQPVDRLLTSPLLRARQTAEIAGERLGVPAEVDDRLREFDVGRYEGSSEPSHWDEYDEVVAAWLLDGDLDRRVGGGESCRELRERFVSLVDEVAAEPGTTVVVTHGGLLRCALPGIAANVAPAWAYQQTLAPTSTVTVVLRGDRLVATTWADQVLAPGRA